MEKESLGEFWPSRLPETFTVFDVPTPTEIKEDLSQFIGDWIAVDGEGHVLANNSDPARLLEDPRVVGKDCELIPVAPHELRL